MNQAKRLKRSRHDRVIGGVAGGLAEYFAIDPILVRVAFVASLALGGLGVIAYLALLIAVPVEGDPDEPVPLPSGTRRLMTVAGTIALGVLAIGMLAWVGPDWHFGPFFGGAFWILAIIAVVLVVREMNRRREGGPGDGTGAPGAAAPGEAGLPGPPASYGPAPSQVDSPTQNAPTAPTEPAEPRSARGRARFGEILTYLAIGFTALVVMAVLAVGAAWATAEGAGVAVAAVIVLIGAGLVVFGIRGRRNTAWWLIAPALALAIPMGAVAAADIELHGGYGDETHVPARAAEIPDGGYEMAIGSLTVDLRGYDWRRGESLRLPVELGIGAAHVVVPDRVCVQADIETKAGVLDVRGSQVEGVDVNRVTAPPMSGAPRLILDGEVQLGAFEVVDSTRWDLYDAGDRFDHRWDDGEARDAREAAAAACEPDPRADGGRG